jgi:cell volume regulation protein A
VATGSPADGRTIAAVAERVGDMWVSIVVRDAQLVTVRDTTPLRAGDDVVVLADPDLHHRLVREFQTAAAKDPPPRRSRPEGPVTGG